MNKERYDQIIDISFGDYLRTYKGNFVMDKEEFINAIKTNPEFAEHWGLKIRERELSWESRSKLLSTEQFHEFGFLSPFTDVIINLYLNQHNIPTKLITITYNNETIEVYG